jgi:hypothetical protein
MASSTIKPMPQTIEAYKALAQRENDLIAEMKAEHQAEVSELKARLNNFEQKRVNGKEAVDLLMECIKDMYSQSGNFKKKTARRIMQYVHDNNINMHDY